MKIHSPLRLMDSPVSPLTSARPGFTLFEVLLVLGLVLILTSMVFPSLRLWTANLPLQQAEAEVRQSLMSLRIQAIRTGEPQHFSFQPGTSLFQVSIPKHRGIAAETRSLKEGVRFASAHTVQESATFIQFSPNGLGKGMQIALIDAEGRMTRLQLDRLSGTVETLHGN